MTLDEAIRHAEEVAEENEEWYMENPNILGYQEKYYDCKKCAEEHRQLAEWLRELKKLREAATNTDAISRQEAINALGEAPEVWTDSPEEFAALNQWKMDMVAIKAVPSTDRSSGHWVLVNRGLYIYMCDRCGEILQIDSVPIWDYCPVCGARMEGETDGRPNQQKGGN